MTIPNGDQWAAAFLAGEPEYTAQGWVDAYASTLLDFKPELTRSRAIEAALLAFAREGHMNPKISAGLDVLLGPL